MTTWSVSNAQALTQTLATAQSGDTILLAAGTYGPVVIDSRVFGGAGVTIQSADASRPAVLSELTVRSSEGLTFSGLEFVVEPAKGDNPIQILKSKSIQLTGLDVHGTLNADPSDDKAAVFIQNGSNISITQSEFHQLRIGVGFLDSSGVRIVGNDFYEIRSDGVHGGGTSNLEISGNSFTDFFPATGDHPDAIQLWTANTTTSAHDIVINNNLITRGKGAPVQGIFLRDEAEALPYLRVTITGNVLAGAGYNGITLSGGNDFVISNNTVTGYSDYKSWIMVENSSGGTLSNNEIQTLIVTKSAGVLELGNKFIAPISAEGVLALDAWLSTHHDQLNMPIELGLPFSGAPGVVEKLYGGAGDEVLQAAQNDQGWIEAGAGNDTVTGGAQADYLRGGDGDDLLQGGGGFDDMHGNAGRDTLYGGDGDDWVVGGQGDDSLQGDAGFDVVYGNLGNDTVYGGEGGDWVRGGQGEDLLFGGGGNDFMAGDRGSDTMSGGAGADTFYFFAGSGLDRVTDFSVAGGDTVRLDPGVAYTLHQIGGDTVLRLAGGDELVLVGLQTTGAAPGWVVFG